MPNRAHKVEIVKGNHNNVLAVYINDIRVAGSKPRIGGTTLAQYSVHHSELSQALRKNR